MDFGSTSIKLNKVQTFNNVRTDTKYFNNVIQTTEYEDIDYNNTAEESDIDWSIDYTAEKALKIEYIFVLFLFF